MDGGLEASFTTDGHRAANLHREIIQTSNRHSYLNLVFRTRGKALSYNTACLSAFLKTDFALICFLEP